MNQCRQKEPLADSGDQSFTLPGSPFDLMLDDDLSQEFKDQPTLDPHNDARQLVRLLQCRFCSRPLSAPVTLPCGHTCCRACLPPLQPRPNISYPNTPDRQFGIACPTCGSEFPTAECSGDVTLTKVMDVIWDKVQRSAKSTGQPPITLEELVPQDMGALKLGGETHISEKPVTKDFNGGRLQATFQMAADKALPFTSDVIFHASPSDAHAHCKLDKELFDHLREGAQREMDCLVCYNTMLEPTTLPCGHTFCRHCLVRVMDHSSICPVCRRGIHIPPIAIQSHPSNSRLVSLLKSFCPDLIDARAEALRQEELPGGEALDTPLFVCTLSLPETPTFLHIFEPRYRLMMRRCLEGNKRFGMLMYNRASTPQGNLGPVSFLEYGTMLEIVNFELLRDGRSFIETRGVGRFRVLAHGMLDGYIVGRVERIDDVPILEEEQIERQNVLAAQAWADDHNALNPDDQLTPDNFPALLSTDELFRRCKEFVEMMSRRSAPWLSARIVSVHGPLPDNHRVFPFWFAAVLPIAEEEKYRLLATTRVRERLQIVYSWIKRIEGQRWPSGNACNIL